jgi:Uri superfamily endonuclease
MLVSVPSSGAGSRTAGPSGGTRVSTQRVGLTEPHGTYALLLGIRRRARLRVGALGEVSLEPGFLVYVGSAQGSGGLRARLAHHCRTPTRSHWHIDYLAAETSVLGAWFCASSGLLEHRWALAVRLIRGAVIPAAGFGSSDCACPAHLLWFARRPSAATLRRALRNVSAGSEPRYLGPKRLRSFAGVAA